MLRASLYDYSDANIVFTETIIVTNISIRTQAPSNNRNKNVILKKCAPLTDFISEINNKEIDHAKGINVVMPVYNLTEYSDNYSKIYGSLWQYYRDEPFIGNNWMLLMFLKILIASHLNINRK